MTLTLACLPAYAPYFPAVFGGISSLPGIGGGSLVRPLMKSFLKVPEKIAGMILRLSVPIVYFTKTMLKAAKKLSSERCMN